MEIGIDSFASGMAINGQGSVPAFVLSQLLERSEHADKCGRHTFGIGEHHRKEFLDSAPIVIF